MSAIEWDLIFIGRIGPIGYTNTIYSSMTQYLGVGAHSYADDSQLYLHCLAVDQRSAALRLAECIERVEGWVKSNRLKLNSDKTQFLWFRSRQKLAKIDTKTMTIGEHSIESSTSAKNLGVTFDSEFPVEKTGKGPACQQHHSQLFLSVETAKIHPTITFHRCRENIGPFLLSSRVEYCNSIFYGATDVENTAIRPQRCSQVDLEVRTGGSSPISLLCWGISSTGFPSVSVSTSRSQSLSTTPSMVEVRHTSAALAILSEKSAPGLT